MAASSSRNPGQPPLSPTRRGNFQPLTSISQLPRHDVSRGRRKAHSAWSSRSSSPARDDTLGNRPRSKSSAALSQYFATAPPHTESSYEALRRSQSPETTTGFSPGNSPVFPRVRSLTDVAGLSSQYTPTYVQPAFGAPAETSFRREQWRLGLGLEEINTKLGLLNRGRRRLTAYDTETETEPLPTARIPPPPTEKPPLARRLVPVFMFLCRLLSIVPAAFGTTYHLYLAYVTPFSHLTAFPCAVDHLIVSSWSAATGAWCYLLASGLLRRWLMYYSLPSTLIRQLSLQAICWPSTRLTVQIFGPQRPLMAWVVIGTTTCFSNGVQIWVTSNIRLASVAQKDAKDGRDKKGLGLSVGSSLDYWLGKRKIDWSKVVKQCVIPLSILYFLTTWALLLDRDLWKGPPAW